MAPNLWGASLIFVHFLGLSASVSFAEQPDRSNPSAQAELGANAVLVSYNSADDRQMKVYLTGYSFWDNTPPGSAEIAKPVVHNRAGGTGTYQDPVTVAVGHTNFYGRRKMDFPAGTRFYFPSLQKYGIVEDLCGNGNHPQDGPCHTGHNGLVWLDIYVGGKSSSQSAAYSCMNAITGVQSAILNPSTSYRVQIGEITTSHCGMNG